MLLWAEVDDTLIKKASQARVHLQILYGPEYPILNLGAGQKHATNGRGWTLGPVSIEQEKGPGL